MKTCLSGDRPALLWDPGTYDNITGDEWASIMTRHCVNADVEVQQERMEKSLLLSGVGKGTQEASWRMNFTTATPDVNGDAWPGTYTAPVVGQPSLSQQILHKS